MKKFEVGDKVSFINEKLNGVVIRLLPNGNCMVEIEDGFEMETTPSELLKLPEPIKDKNNLSAPQTAQQQAQKQAAEEPLLRNTLQGLNDNVCLVLMPANANQVLTGGVKYYLVNNSKYNVLCSFSNKVNRQLYGIASAKVDANSELLLGSITRDVLMDTESLMVQLIFHQQNLFQQLSVITKEIPIEYPDLNHVNKNISGAVAFSKIVTLLSFEETAEEDLTELVKKYKADQASTSFKHDSTKNAVSKLKEQLHQYNVSPGLMEVDLHIEELIDDTAGMSNTEILQVQLQYFRKAIDNAMYRKAHKITFIHGVGNGRLKNAILEELSAIAHISFHDAPYQRYGFGATEVNLK